MVNEPSVFEPLKFYCIFKLSLVFFSHFFILSVCYVDVFLDPLIFLVNKKTRNTLLILKILTAVFYLSVEQQCPSLDIFECYKSNQAARVNITKSVGSCMKWSVGGQKFQSVRVWLNKEMSHWSLPENGRELEVVNYKKYKP